MQAAKASCQKLADAPYRSGRSKAWVKSKCIRRDEFVIVGWEPSTSRVRPFASLLMGAYERKTFVYCGKVGTGRDDAAIDEIAAQLDRLARKTPAIAAPVDAIDARWVRPR